MTQPIDEPSDLFSEEESETNRPSVLTILILLLLIMSMLASLLWPFLRRSVIDALPRPTPTSPLLREA